jgi:hypothetical protein
MDDRVALAALRASRVLPADRFDGTALAAAARTAGRSIARYVRPDGVETVVLGYAQPSPLDPDVSGGPQSATPVPLLVLAACLRLCWPDPDEPLLPGDATSVYAVKRALATLEVQRVEQAVNRLRGTGHLVYGPGRGTLRLGPEIALWTDIDIDALRREYHRLPCELEDP